MIRRLRTALVVGIMLSVAVPFAVAANASPKATRATLILPGDQQACNAVIAAHPEYSGRPCVLTIDYQVTDAGSVLVPTVAAASGTACNYIIAQSLGWWVREDFCWRWDGSTSSVDWTNCSQWNVLVGINITWCSWFNGWTRGYNYADVGANWIKSLIVNGFPIQTSCWMRLYLYNNGTTGSIRGAC